MKTETVHKSDCSTHNEPAYPNSSCDCQPLELHTKQMMVDVWQLPDSCINVECEVKYTLDRIESVTYMGDNVSGLVDLEELFKRV